MISKIETLRALYRSQSVVLITAAGGVIYYLLIQYLVRASNYGIFLITVPAPLLYLLILSSAVLLAISIYSITLSLNTLESSEVGVLGIVTTFAGGMVASCGCSAPILASVLYFFALNTATVSTFTSAVGNNQTTLIILLVFFNLAVSYYHISKLSKDCVINREEMLIHRKGKG